MKSRKKEMKNTTHKCTTRTQKTSQTTCKKQQATWMFIYEFNNLPVYVLRYETTVYAVVGKREIYDH